jgi:hypothetical protein
MAKEFRKLQNKIIVEGHTDSRPLAAKYGYTNWELSSNRANAARAAMESGGLNTNQISQVRGYAATQPRDPEHPEHYSNRRVSIIVVMKNAMRGKEYNVLDNISDGIVAPKQEQPEDNQLPSPKRPATRSNTDMMPPIVEPSFPAIGRPHTSKHKPK